MPVYNEIMISAWLQITPKRYDQTLIISRKPAFYQGMILPLPGITFFRGWDQGNCFMVTEIHGTRNPKRFLVIPIA